MSQDAKITEHKDGTVTVVTTKGKRHHGVAMVLDTDDVLKAQAGGFANFLRDYAVVGLAIGFIAGQQANAVVKQLVTSFLDPLFKLWLGKDLSSRVATVHHGDTPIQMAWGAFVYLLIEFFFVLLMIYLLVKIFRLDKLKKKEEPKK